MKKKISPIKIPKLKANDLPATRGMLKLVRDEVKEDLKGLEAKFDTRFDGVHAKIDANHSELKSEIHQVKSEIHQVKSQIHRLGLLVEEQNANNRIVLEGLQAVWERQDRLEAKIS